MGIRKSGGTGGLAVGLGAVSAAGCLPPPSSRSEQAPHTAGSAPRTDFRMAMGRGVWRGRGEDRGAGARDGRQLSRCSEVTVAVRVPVRKARAAVFRPLFQALADVVR